MKKINLIFSAMCLTLFMSAQTIADFENLLLPTDSFWNGADLTGGFSSGNIYFHNDYNTTFDAWSGFSYSNMKDSITPGFSNQYSAITASGVNGSSNYAVGVEYGNAKVILTGNAAGGAVEGLYVTNTTYTYLSMKDGDMFAKKFGGITGNDEDWLKLIVKGWLHGTLKPNEVEFYLADYRSADNSEDYIVDNWQWLNLLPLGNVDSLQFFMLSSDTGMFGMNTPAYFCIDDFTTVDEVNEPPVANDDIVIINYLQDTIINVLANDLDNTALPLSIKIITNPFIPGAYSADTNGMYVYYQPAPGIVSTDTLYYQLCDAAMECDTARLVIQINSPTGIFEMNAGDVQVYPNPFIDRLYLKYSEETSLLQLFNAEGKLIQSINTNIDKNETFFEASYLLPGVYYVKLTGVNSSTSIKVIRQ